MPRISRKEAERAARPPDLSLTPCHGVSRLGIPLLVLNEDRTETIIGRVIYCGRSGFEDGRPFECYNVLRVVIESPQEGLSVDLVRSLCQNKPPTYELSCGYHLRLQAGRWQNVRDLRRKVAAAQVPGAQTGMPWSEDYE